MTLSLEAFLPLRVSNMCSAMTLCKAEPIRVDSKVSAISEPARPADVDLEDQPVVREARTVSTLPPNAFSGLEGLGSFAKKPNLAGRRGMKDQLLVNTDPDDLEADIQSKLHGVQMEFRARQPRRIDKTNRFSDLYELGEEVLPSCHPGMEVRHARRLLCGTDVVVKVRRKPESFSDDDEEKDWRDSTELMLNLPHNSSIARIYEVFEDKDAYYVVMEKAGGMDLCETLRSGQALPVTEVKEVLRQLLSGLAELHDRGCIHKDLKLENVMLNRSPSSDAVSTCCSERSATKDTAIGSSPLQSRRVSRERSSGSICGISSVGSSPISPVSVKVIDFDTLEQVTSQPSGPRKEIQGTDQYLAPEAYSGHYSRSSDVFAVGVIAYSLLTGMFPFSDDIFNCKRGDYVVGSPKMREVREKLCNFKVDWSHPVFTSHPQARDLVQRMLAMDKRSRPTARSALLHTWLSGSSRGNTEDLSGLMQLHSSCSCPTLATASST